MHRTMVSYENGKFILRKRDDRQHSRSRRYKLPRVIIIALGFSFFYFINGRSQQEPDFSLLRAARDANVKPYVNQTGLTSKRPSQNNDNADDNVQSASGSHDNKQSTDRGESSSNQCKISLNKTFLKYLQTLDPIPKKIHIMFPDKNYWRKNPIPFVEHSILSLKKLNPDWNVTVYDDEMVDDVIRKAADSDLIPQEECDILVGKKDDEGNVIKEAAHIVERSDIARLLLIYMEGGFYIDADRLISKNIEDVIQPVTRMCLPTSDDSNFCQDLMCSSRKNDLFLFMIREATKSRLPLKRREGWVQGGGLFELGPVLYNKQILIHVFGGNEDTYDKCVGDFSVARELVAEGSDRVIVTKKETACNDGLLVDDTLPRCHDRGKLYDMYGMEDWAPQVDARWAQ